MTIYMLEIKNPNKNLPTELLNYISFKRREKINRYKSNIDQLLSLYAALVVKMGISEITGWNYNSLVFDTDKYGKPFLKNNKNIYFNLSHTNSYILCGISCEKIGVDVENICKYTPYDIMGDCFHPQEILYINEITNKNKSAYFRLFKLHL